jgi:hypothetical protein
MACTQPVLLLVQYFTRGNDSFSQQILIQPVCLGCHCAVFLVSCTRCIHLRFAALPCIVVAQGEAITRVEAGKGVWHLRGGGGCCPT